MEQILIIDKNAVYELDEACLKKKQENEKREEKEKQRESRRQGGRETAG